MSQVFPIIPASSKTLWPLGLLVILIVGILCLFIMITYSCRNISVELSQTELHIQDYLYGRSIPRTSLIPSQSLILDLSQTPDKQPKWRINGIGLPGYQAGWFKLKNGEKALLFVTNPHQVVYIPTHDGYSLLLSVQEPERFLNSLRLTSSQ